MNSPESYVSWGFLVRWLIARTSGWVAGVGPSMGKTVGLFQMPCWPMETENGRRASVRRTGGATGGRLSRKEVCRPLQRGVQALDSWILRQDVTTLVPMLDEGEWLGALHVIAVRHRQTGVS